MTENELTGTLELSAGGGLVPAQIKLSLGLTRRLAARGLKALDPAIATLGEEEVNRRLAASEELDVLVLRAITAAASSAYADKRRLLGMIVQSAVLDDAKIDEGALILNVLEQVDAPHIRCLEAIHRAELKAKDSGEMGPIARGAGKPLTQPVREVVEQYPAPLIQALERLGLIDGSVTWDGTLHITGTTNFGAQILEDLRQTDAVQT